MINSSITNPKSIVVVGASNNLSKPGGKLLNNILQGTFKGDLYVVNPKEEKVQGLKSFKSVDEIEQVDLAILAIPASYCVNVVKTLASQKKTKGFIIISAGFGEVHEEGKQLEEELLALMHQHDACLIGPNCIGVFNQNYQGVFTTPIPEIDPKGCDLVSSSGATAVFIMEAGVPVGLRFSSVFSVGNSAQIGVEEVLEYWDHNFDPESSSRIKLLYIESIKNPVKLYHHARSLIQKGCRIAAIKSGVSEAGSRAALSHTGALASSDEVIRALFRKTGIVYCSSRSELISVASIFTYAALPGKRFAVITHAGGSAVMLSDALSKSGLEVPEIVHPSRDELLDYLYPGSSVTNPIDFLATGTADQLGIIIDYCEHRFDEIDAIIVVFGSPGLFDVKNVYKVLNVKMNFGKKPIFPVLPSLINSQNEINYFISKGRVNFPDEVELGTALGAVYNTPRPEIDRAVLPRIDKEAVRKVIDSAEDGFLDPEQNRMLFKAAGIPYVQEDVVTEWSEAQTVAEQLGFPLVMKVVGPVHKSDVKGVTLNINSMKVVEKELERLMAIEGAEGVLMQQMIGGLELFIGAKAEPNYGHLIFCGLGGIFVEALGDVSSAFSPVSKKEASYMISNLKGHALFDGIRGRDPLNRDFFIELIQRVSALCQLAPEIEELDLNPLLAKKDQIIAVDSRVKVLKGV